MSDVLRTSDLSKRFRATPVLSQLNLAVPEGSVYALVGPNGAGKTTCIQILMNLLISPVNLFGLDNIPPEAAQIVDLVSMEPLAYIQRPFEIEAQRLGDFEQRPVKMQIQGP